MGNSHNESSQLPAEHAQADRREIPNAASDAESFADHDGTRGRKACNNVLDTTIVHYCYIEVCPCSCCGPGRASERVSPGSWTWHCCEDARRKERHRVHALPRLRYATFGASEHIRDQPFSRSSAATTPFTRVPRSSRCAGETPNQHAVEAEQSERRILTLLFRRQIALSSKRIHRPSGLRVSFFVRTTTALRTSPRRTVGKRTEEIESALLSCGIGTLP